MDIEYSVSLPAILIGIIIVAIGALMVKYYNKIADVFPVGNYTKWRLAGFIVIGVGFITITNLPSFILMQIVNAVINGGF